MTGLRSWDRCASCRDFLDLALASARELSRIERRLAAMSEGEGLRAAPLCGPVSGGSRDGGGMARTDARIDYEAKLSGRVGECRGVVDDLRALCYGTSSGAPPTAWATHRTTNH